MYCIVLYCIVLYCIVLYCIVLYCIVLYCIVLYCIVSETKTIFMLYLIKAKNDASVIYSKTPCAIPFPTSVIQVNSCHAQVMNFTNLNRFRY